MIIIKLKIINANGSIALHGQRVSTLFPHQQKLFKLKLHDVILINNFPPDVF